MMLDVRLASEFEIATLLQRAVDPSARRAIDQAAWIDYHFRMGPCYVGYLGQNLVLAGGIDIPRPGVGVPWVILDNTLIASVSYIKTVLFSVRLMIECIQDSFSLKKIHTFSDAALPGSQTFLKHVGFRLRGRRSDRYIFVYDGGKRRG